MDAIREKASNLRVTINALVDIYLRFADEKIPLAALERWSRQPPDPPYYRPGRDLGRRTDRVLAAFDALGAKSEFGAETYCFSALELATEASMLPKQAFGALMELQREGRVDGIEAPEFDAWGRPKESFWWPAGRSVTHPRFPTQRPGEAKDRGWVSYVQCWELLESWIRGGREKALLYQRVVDVRRMAFSQLMDPWVAGLIERDARWAFGISARALALKPRIVQPETGVVSPEEGSR